MIKEMYIKTIVRYFFTVIRIIITKILTILSGSKNMKKNKEEKYMHTLGGKAIKIALMKNSVDQKD